MAPSTSTAPSLLLGMKSNWTQTIPGKSWITFLPLCGPLEPRFDQTPGEVELV